MLSPTAVFPALGAVAIGLAAVAAAARAWRRLRRELDAVRASYSRLNNDHTVCLVRLRKAEDARNAERAEHALVVDRLVRSNRIAAQQLDEANRLRESAEDRLVRDFQDRADGEIKTATVTLELTHRLEHAEQSVRDGAARAVRDHDEIRRLGREATELRSRLVTSRGERDDFEARWRRAAESLVTHATSHRRAEAIIGRTHEAIGKAREETHDALNRIWDAVTGEQSEKTRDCADRANRLALRDLIPLDMLPDEPQAETEAGTETPG